MMHRGDRRWLPSSAAKRLLSSLLAAAGLKVSRIRNTDSSDGNLVPVHADFFSALHDSMGGRPTRFRCPTENIVDFTGFGFGKNQFHPFVAASRITNNLGDAEAEAFLYAFYDRHKPKNAEESFLDFRRSPAIFSQSDPHLYHLAPWVAFSPAELSAQVRRWVYKDNIEHGHPSPALARNDFPMHGPVSSYKVHLEFNRLRRLAESIRFNGYDRSFGDCSFIVIRRGDDFRFIPFGGGYHRTATMAALDYEWIPGRILGGPIVFDSADVDYWSQVRMGIWTRTDALAYVDYLFDYNSRDWYLHNWDESERAAHSIFPVEEKIATHR